MRGHMITLLFAAVLVLTAGCGSKPKSECLFGDKIPQKDFEDTSNAAGDIIMLVEGEQWKDLYESGTEEMRTSQTRDQFKLPLELFVKSFGPLSYSRIEELYYMTSKSKEDRVMITCNLGEPGIDDIYGMPANRELAVAVFNSRTEQEQVRVVVTLEKEKGIWKLRSVSLNPTTMKKRTAEYFLKTAQQYREKNFLRAAALYYKAAMLLLEMGVNVNEFSTKAIASQLTQIKTDYLPMGETQIWTMPSGNAIKVTNMDVAYDKGKVLVQAVFYVDTVADTEKVRKLARELAEYINQNFPEYREGFDGIRASAFSEKKEEAFAAIHNQFLFSELPTPTGAPAVPTVPAVAPGATAAPATPAPGTTAPAPTPPAPVQTPGATAPAPTAPAPATPPPAAPAAPAAP